MRRIALVLVAAIIVLGWESTADRADPKLEGLSFLAGSWHRQNGNTVMEEHWTAPSGGCMMGMMRQVTEGKVGVREFILLEEGEDGIRMSVKHVGPKMADIPGRAYTLKLAKFDGTEAVFENPGEGTLKAVIYRKLSDGGLYAGIRVDRNGQIRDIDFHFKRMERK